MSPRAPPEGSTAEEPQDPSPPRLSAIEVLIKARPPYDTMQYETVSDYPTPSSDHSQTSAEPAKHSPTQRKRTRQTAFNDSQAIKEAGDNNANVPYGLHRPKRQRDSKLTSQNSGKSRQRLDGSTSSMTGNNHEAMPRGSSITSASSLKSQHAHATRSRGTASSGERSQVALSVSRASASSEPSMIGVLQNQACTSCGVDRAYLMRLSQNILRWADLPDSESLLTKGTSLSVVERGTIMLCLAIRDLRDHLLEPLFEEDIEVHTHKSQSFHRTRARSRTAYTPALSADLAEHYSDTADGSSARNHKLSEARTENTRTKVCKPRGRPPRWTTDDEDRLQEYLLNGMDWPDIATKLNRSESGVQKHAQTMDQNEKSWSKLEDCRLRAFVIEGMDWSVIAAKLKRPKHSVALHWALSKE
jgi:hypothetical protein